MGPGKKLLRMSWNTFWFWNILDPMNFGYGISMSLQIDTDTHSSDRISRALVRSGATEKQLFFVVTSWFLVFSNCSPTQPKCPHFSLSQPCFQCYWEPWAVTLQSLVGFTIQRDCLIKYFLKLNFMSLKSFNNNYIWRKFTRFFLSVTCQTTQNFPSKPLHLLYILPNDSLWDDCCKEVRSKYYFQVL